MRDNRDGFDDTVAKTAKIDIRTKSFETDHRTMVCREKNERRVTNRVCKEEKLQRECSTAKKN